MQFQISDELIEKIRFLIEEKNDEELLLHLEDVHHAVCHMFANYLKFKAYQRTNGTGNPRH